MAFAEANYMWAAGLIEGEGCFSLSRNTKSRGGKAPRILVQMNDKEIIEKLSKIFPNRGKIYYRPPRNKSKESWCFTVYREVDILFIIECLYAHLGKRRKDKCQELLSWINDKAGAI